MFELIAESSAIEDTFYYLEKALQTERITLDVFLKVLTFCTLAHT